MAEPSLLRQIDDWLNEQALGQPNIVDLFEGLCQRLYAIGVPVGRGLLMWSTLHPLFRAEMVLWRRGKPAELSQFTHQDTRSEQWLRSPMHFMLSANVDVLRRQLDGPRKLLDFAVLKDLAEEGYTDYLVISTDLFSRSVYRDDNRRGIFVTWAADRPGGFSDDDLDILQQIQRRLATACKTVVQSHISRNISEAYLGRLTGARVLDGLIRLGDGEETRALVWYSDLRESTRLAEEMPSPAFIELLNAYFECAARPVISAGGEVLAFIGDAVLAILPISNDHEMPGIVERTVTAVQESLALQERVTAERRAAGLPTFRYGIALNIGSVMYGNIGVPERLAFSAIGPTVIEVARIEKLTKEVGSPVLATGDIARHRPDFWQSVGEQRLAGVSLPQELFSFRGPIAQLPPKPAPAATEPIPELTPAAD